MKKEIEVKFSDKNKSPVKIYVQKPDNQTVQKADRVRAKAWNECVIDNIITKKELSELMRQRGIWDEAKDASQKEIVTNISKLEQQLYLECGKRKSKQEDGKRIAVEIRKQRVKLRELISEKMSLEGNTAESLSDNARFDFLVASCTFYEDGKRVYKDMEDYNSKSSDEIAFSAASGLAEILYSLDSDFEKNLPENKWLKNKALVNDELSLINESGKRVDLEGRLINEDGYYIDEDGNRVDIEGHPLDEEGFYQEIDDDSEKAAKKTTPRKKNADSE
jgi:hypothetical protein